MSGRAVDASGGRSRLGRLAAAWRRVARRVGDFQARLLLTIVYFLVVAPFAVAVRWLTDPLAIKARSPRGWRARPPDAASPLEGARRQS